MKAGEQARSGLSAASASRDASLPLPLMDGAPDSVPDAPQNGVEPQEDTGPVDDPMSLTPSKRSAAESVAPPEVSEPGSVSRRLRSKSGVGDHNPS